MLDLEKEIDEDNILQAMISAIKSNNNVISHDLQQYLFKKYCKRANLDYCQPAMCPFRSMNNCDCTNLKNYILKEYNLKLI